MTRGKGYWTKLLRGTSVIYTSRRNGALSRCIHRHCEERSDEAIQGRSTVFAALDRHAAKGRLAMTGQCFRRLVSDDMPSVFTVRFVATVCRLP